jgi:hypothetical protein
VTWRRHARPGRRIEAAQAHGDKQAEKEMTVFLKKLERQA